VVTALLHSRRSYAAPAFSPILNNLVVSAMFFALPSVIDYAIDTDASVFRAADDTTLLLVLGLGTTAGVAAMALGLVPSLARQRIRLRFRPDWRHPAVRTVIRLSGWTVGYVVANQIALYVVLALANGSGEGELSAYQAAFIFFQLPHGLVAVSVMTTFLPELTEAARSGDRPAFRERFALGIRLIAVAALPAAAGYVALSREIVDLLPLGSTSVDLTADVLAMFALGLLPFSVYLLTFRGFYAHQDTRTPFVVNVFENGLNIAFAFPLVAAAGVAGLAGAFSLAYALGSLVALWALARRVGGLPVRELVDALARMLMAAVACGGVAWLVARGTDDLPVELAVGSAAVAGAAAYVLVALALRVEELTLARRLVTNRLRRPTG
jgi:putative peptidoglycan lipid II flippase